MAYRVDLTERAVRDLRRLFVTIRAGDVAKARVWFNGLEAMIFSLDEHPARGAVIPENTDLRHLLYVRKPHIYLPIYAIDDGNRIVTVLHIRHGARTAFSADDPDDEDEGPEPR